MSYSSGSRQAQLGDGFRSHVISELNARGHSFVDTTALIDEESGDYASYDSTLGDAIDEIWGLHLECKTSEDYPKSVTIKGYGRDNFIGDRRFYVTSFARRDPDGRLSYENVKFFRSSDVRARLLELKDDQRWGVKKSKDGQYQPFNHESILPYARGIDEFLERAMAEFPPREMDIDLSGLDVNEAL